VVQARLSFRPPHNKASCSSHARHVRCKLLSEAFPFLAHGWRDRCISGAPLDRAPVPLDPPLPFHLCRTFLCHSWYVFSPVLSPLFLDLSSLAHHFQMQGRSQRSPFFPFEPPTNPIPFLTRPVCKSGLNRIPSGSILPRTRSETGRKGRRTSPTPPRRHPSPQAAFSRSDPRP